jgi:hypothetical protein
VLKVQTAKPAVKQLLQPRQVNHLSKVAKNQYLKLQVPPLTQLELSKLSHSKLAEPENK